MMTLLFFFKWHWGAGIVAQCFKVPPAMLASIWILAWVLPAILPFQLPANVARKTVGNGRWKYLCPWCPQGRPGKSSAFLDAICPSPDCWCVRDVKQQKKVWSLSLVLLYSPSLSVTQPFKQINLRKYFILKLLQIYRKFKSNIDRSHVPYYPFPSLVVLPNVMLSPPQLQHK